LRTGRLRVCSIPARTELPCRWRTAPTEMRNQKKLDQDTVSARAHPLLDRDENDHRLRGNGRVGAPEVDRWTDAEVERVMTQLGEPPSNGLNPS
jgi:hypothetical protein